MNSIRISLIATSLGLILVSFTYYILFGKNKDTWTLAGGESLGHYDAVTNIIGEILKKETKANIILKNSSGSGENLKLLEQGETDVCLIQNDMPGHSKVRAIATLYSEVLHIIVRENNMTFSKLQSKNISIGSKGGGTENLALELFKQFGISKEQAFWRNEGLAQGLKSLETNQTDAVCVVTGLGNELLSHSMSANDFHFLDLGNNPISRLAHSYPFIHSAEIPVGVYTIRPENEIPAKKVKTIGVKVIFAANSNLKERDALELTRIIHENRSLLAKKYPLMSQISVPGHDGKLQFPIHEGAQQYYDKNEPNFLQVWAEPMALFISVLAIAWGLAIAIREIFIQKKKDSLDQYFEKVEILTGELINNPIKERVQEIASELHEIRKETIQKLVSEELAANESFVIFQRQLHTAQQLVSESSRSLK